MELYINEALKRAGEEFSFEATESIEPQQYSGRMLQFETPVKVKGTYTFDGKAFSVTGEVTVSVLSTCARCNDPFMEEIKFSFEERFVRQVFEDDEESYRYSGDTISLNEVIMDNLFLQLPLVSVCKEDCQGLCPVCGVNRNVEQCSCCSVTKNNAFSALLDWQNEYKEV